MNGPRGDVDMVGHNIFLVPEHPVGNLPPINNVIYRARKPEEQWVEDVTRRIGDWRAKLRSTYIRWALAINGLEVAANRYAEPEWGQNNKFYVSSLRPDQTGHLSITPIALWDGTTASKNHRETMPMLAAFGIIDLYARLEEIVFEMYRMFLNHNRQVLLRGDDFQDLRRLRREAENDPAKRPDWEQAWQERLDGWQRRRLYDGLDRVFKAFCDSAGVKAPSSYQHTTVETWSECVRIIGLVRHALVHGVATVNHELAAACQQPYAMTFDFQEGDPLEIKLYHLQGVDCFCEQILDALNLSLLELVLGPADAWSEKEKGSTEEQQTS